jgi:hypothetical protein
MEINGINFSQGSWNSEANPVLQKLEDLLSKFKELAVADPNEVVNFLYGKLIPFLDKNRDEIAQICEKNGWPKVAPQSFYSLLYGKDGRAEDGALSNDIKNLVTLVNERKDTQGSWNQLCEDMTNLVFFMTHKPS